MALINIDACGAPVTSQTQNFVKVDLRWNPSQGTRRTPRVCEVSYLTPTKQRREQAEVVENLPDHQIYFLTNLSCQSSIWRVRTSSPHRAQASRTGLGPWNGRRKKKIGGMAMEEGKSNRKWGSLSAWLIRWVLLFIPLPLSWTARIMWSKRSTIQIAP